MNIKLYSYLFGLFGTDGSIKRNRNNTHIYDITLELIDNDIIEKINNKIENCSLSERFRDTNFKKNYHSYVLRCHNKEILQWCEINGMPLRDKTNCIAPPIGNYSKPDFWRGVIDGDGSIGIKTVECQPFISLVTKSELLKEAFCDYIYELTGFRPNLHRNKRDGIYNITVHGEKALIITKAIYQDADIYLQRKYDKFLEIQHWTKKNMKGVVRKKWTTQEIEDLLQLSDEDFHKKYPERTMVAIKAKRRKLKKEVMLNVNE